MNSKKLLWRGLLALLFFVPLACEKNDDGSYVAPITNYEKIKGEWSLKNLKQYDEILVASAIKPNELDLSSKFNFKTFKITFNVDSTGEVVPTTFLVEGSAPELFLKSGFWDVDYLYTRVDANVTKILLYSDAAKTTLVDELLLITTPGIKSVLDFKLVRYSSGTPYVSYLYSCKPFTK